MTQDKNLLNRYQKSFPITSRPFQVIAEQEGMSEEQVLSAFQRLLDQKMLSRIGPVFKPHAFGASTLAAMKVPTNQLDEVAEWITTLPEVNHNYEREDDDLNLWFVLTTQSEEELQKTLTKIKTKTNLDVLDLRLEKEFRIDLGFDING